MMTGKNDAASGEEPVGDVSLAELFFTFLKIGSTAFGGFMALISVVQNYVVERRKLLRAEDMLDGVSLATILPGPVAVNVVAYAGYRVRGARGALVSAAGVILPSFLLITGLSVAYVRFGRMPAAGKIFQGFIPAVAAVILVAAWNMGAKAIKGVPEALLAFAAAVLLLGVGGFFVTLAIVAGSGLAGILLFPAAAEQAPKTDSGRDVPKVPGTLHGAAAPLAAAPVAGLLAAPLIKLFLTFGVLSLLLFGGGYVFIPLIQHVVVDAYGWVNRQEFIDAIALGQVTPGPILISAAFIGYKVAGFAGAAAATVAIFSPPAFVMVLCARSLDRIKRSARIKAALRGIRPAIIGLIVAAGLAVGRTAPLNGASLFIFGAALIALYRFKVETVWIIPLAGAAGLLLY